MRFSSSPECGRKSFCLPLNADQQNAIPPTSRKAFGRRRRGGSAARRHVSQPSLGHPPGLRLGQAASGRCPQPPGDRPVASVRNALIDRDVPGYFQSLEHLLRYCARPPFALERLSVRRGEDGRIAHVRFVLPRHKAANWVGPGRGRKSTRPGANGVVELVFWVLSCWTGSPISSRRQGSTGIATAASLPRITSSGGP